MFFPRRRIKPTQPYFGVHLFREHCSSRQFATRKLQLHLVQQQHSACPEQAWALARSRWDRIHRSGGIAAAPHINPEQRMLLLLSGPAALPTASSSVIYIIPSCHWPTCRPPTSTPKCTCTTTHTYKETLMHVSSVTHNRSVKCGTCVQPRDYGFQGLPCKSDGSAAAIVAEKA